MGGAYNILGDLVRWKGHGYPRDGRGRRGCQRLQLCEHLSRLAATQAEMNDRHLYRPSR